MPYVVAPVADESPLDDAFARLLAARLYNTDDPLPTTRITVEARLTRAWLEGVRDGGGANADEARRLIAAIIRHDAVEIRQPGNPIPPVP